MKKLFFVSPLVCLLALIFTACEKDEKEGNPKPDPIAESLLICPSPADYHFSGYIFDEIKCMNHQDFGGPDESSQYASYLGSVYKYNPDRTYFELGMETSPIVEGSEHLKVFTPTLNLKDLEEIDQVLSVGKKHFSDSIEFKSPENTGFTVDFLVVESVGEPPYSFPSYATYSTRFGEQQESNIEILSSNRTSHPNDPSRHEIELTFLINCKLYDQDGLYKGSIKNGIFKPWMVVSETE